MERIIYFLMVVFTFTISKMILKLWEKMIFKHLYFNIYIYIHIEIEKNKREICNR